jgi:hypothetical protein
MPVDACVARGRTIEYLCSFVMSKLTSASLRGALRVGITAVAVALVLVPAIKRAQQHVDHRDATRLSIKHSWIGIAPPTKAAIAPQQVLTLPALGSEPDPPRIVGRLDIPVEPLRHPVLDLSPDALRGPPSILI